MSAAVPEPGFGPHTTLSEVQAYLAEHSAKGVDCPACFQRVQKYRRSIGSASARALIELYNAGGLTAFMHWPTVIDRKQADEAKLVHWGLVEEERRTREDGGRAGYWRTTPAGLRFIRGELRVPKYIWLYDSRFLGVDDTETIDIHDALGKKFRLDELLRGI